MASPSSTSKSPSHAQQETVARLSARESFTRGPWRASGQILITGRIDANVYGPNGEDICSVYASDGADGPSSYSAEANARLIAAAPEMLFALQQIVRYADSSTDPAVLALARTTISKALSIQPPVVSRAWRGGERANEGEAMNKRTMEAFGLMREELKHLRTINADMLAALQAQERAEQLNHNRGGYDQWQAAQDEADALRQAAISKALSIQPPSSVAHGVVESGPETVKP